MFKKIRASIGKALDLPQDILLDVPKITVIGDQQVWIENHTGVVEYTAEKVRVNTGLGILAVTGSDFVLVKLSPNEIKVEGKLTGITFGEGQ
ncbi:MAG TPA: sporulation protein YqfC [Desulfobacteria bacterium]|nr:sporulation protein YqfC [Desulfobacteria bacterium]